MTRVADRGWKSGFRAGAGAAIIAGCTFLWATRHAQAEAQFSEDFDSLGLTSFGESGPPELLARGWLFRNQSSPLGVSGFFAGHSGDAHAGSRSLDADLASTDSFGGTVSNWAILPPVPGQVAGDTLVVYASAVMSFNVAARLEVRYSPSQDTGTGSAANDVGDFSQLLLDVNPVPAPGWTRFSVSLPGAGRLALRFFAPDTLPISANGNTWLKLDTLSVGPLPAPPCNLPPLPAVGQTVEWTAAASPYRVCQSMSIPVGGTVKVQPGVVVEFDSDRRLAVSGILDIDATPGAHAILTAPGASVPCLLITGGTLAARHAEFHLALLAGNGSSVLLSDCTFAAGSAIHSDDIAEDSPFVTLERCNFTDASLILSDCLAVLRDNAFDNSYVFLLRTFADLTAANTFRAQPLRISRQESIQPLPIDGVSAAGSSVAGLVLDGGTYRLGPGVVLEANLYPLELRGGLTRDSVVPITGNTNNAINVGNGGFVGNGTWPDRGLPYRLTEPTTSLPGGDLTIDPGVVVEAAHPDAALWFRSTRRSVLDGLPGAPITFRGLNGRSWGGLLFHANSTTGCRLEYCVVEDAEVGVVSTDNLLYVASCVFRNNRIGANTNTFGGIEFASTRFVNNGAGVSFSDLGRSALNSPSNPNSFEGNAVGADAFEFGSAADARNCWWNHASGPQAPGNPGGEGDAIGGAGASGVSFEPFLTAPPDFTNSPPVVRMIEPGLVQRYGSPDYTHTDYLLDPGAKFILHWDVQTDDTIASQRIEFSPDGHYPSRYSVLRAGIPGAARSWQITVPEVGFAVSHQPQFLRIVAVDAAGQEGWDQAAVQVPSGRVTGALALTTELSGMEFVARSAIPEVVQWTGSVAFGSVSPLVVLESDGAAILGLTSGDGRGFFFQKFPLVSTDRARLALQVTNNSNDVAWFFAEGYFTIRHDARLGFTPPSVQLVSPLGGETYAGGATVPITWTASAAEGLRSFDIQASYDAGRTWHPIAIDLPGGSTSFPWRLAANGEISDVRVRVVARDERFQNSAADSGAFAIVSGTQFHRGDCDGDGQVDGVVTDAVFLLNFNFLGGAPPSCLAACDADGDGQVTGMVTDAVYLLNYNFLGGAPPPPPFPGCGPGTEIDEALGCDRPPAACGGLDGDP